MLIISSRDNLWESSDLSDSDKIIDVSLNDDSLGKEVSIADFLGHLANKRVLMLIHGYNNEEDDVVRAYNIIEQNINSNVSQQYDVVMGYTWPGGDDKFEYFAAKNRASAVSPRVGRWVGDMNLHCNSLDIMAHSMGVRVALLALEGFPANTVRNVFTMAAAVDNESIQQDEQYYSSTQSCTQTYVFHSKNDPVLKRAYQWFEFNNALGCTGPEDPSDIIQNSPNVKVINSKRVINRHGGYKNSGAVYRYINDELAGNPHGQYSAI